MGTLLLVTSIALILPIIISLIYQEDDLDALKPEPKVLPAWDPMGALAR